MVMLIAAIVIGYLGWNLYRRFGTNRIQVLNDSRRSTAQIVCRGEYIDGNRHLDVAMALTEDTIFYENHEMQASIDISWLTEVEYASELATGSARPDGTVMRLRTKSQVFEFVIPYELASRWRTMLPENRDAPTPHVHGAEPVGSA